VFALTWSPDGKVLAAGGDFTPLLLWDTAQGKVIREQKILTRNVRGLAYSPDGSLLAGCTPFAAHVWDAATGEERKHLDGGGDSVLFNPDGRLLVVGRSSGGVGLWDPVEGKAQQGFSGNGLGAARSMAFSPDGKGFAASFINHGVRSWDVESRQERPPLPQPATHDATISPDGRQVVCLGQDLRLTLIDAVTGKERFRLTERQWDLPALTFSPDGRTLVTGERDGTVRLWETATGRERLALERHGGRIWSIAFAPDGRRLACSSADTTVLIWDLARRACGGLPTGALTKDVLKSLLADLDDANAERAYRAVWRLAGTPADSVPCLRAVLVSVPTDAAHVKETIAALDDDDFKVREKATQDLAVLGKNVEAELRQALDTSPSPEVKARVRSLLKRFEGEPGGTAVSLRWLRALEILELIDNQASREVLEGLARGAEPVAEEARVTLTRLKKAGN
jgi:WD40 repeat protein